MCVVIVATIYQVWKNRNTAYWYSKVYCIEYIIKETKCIVKHRINACKSAKWSSVDCRWVDEL